MKLLGLILIAASALLVSGEDTLLTCVATPVKAINGLPLKLIKLGGSKLKDGLTNPGGAIKDIFSSGSLVAGIVKDTFGPILKSTTNIVSPPKFVKGFISANLMVIINLLQNEDLRNNKDANNILDIIYDPLSSLGKAMSCVSGVANFLVVPIQGLTVMMNVVLKFMKNCFALEGAPWYCEVSQVAAIASLNATRAALSVV